MKWKTCIVALAASSALTLSACGGGSPYADRIEMRQETQGQLETAQAQLVDLNDQLIALDALPGTGSSDSDIKEKIRALRQQVRELQVLIALIEQTLGTIDDQLAALSDEEPKPPEEPNRTELRAPIIDFGGVFNKQHIGADVAHDRVPRLSKPPQVGRHGGISVFYGTVRDGVGKRELVAYLTADAASLTTGLNPEGFIRRFGDEPPVVRAATGATPDQIKQTVQAVHLINAALPHDWQLRLSDEAGQAGIYRPPDGEIIVEFAPKAEWSAPNPPANAAGMTQRWFETKFNEEVDPNNLRPGDLARLEIARIVSGHVWIDPSATPGTFRMDALVHEIIHALGRNHPNLRRFPNTVMRNDGTAPGVPGHVLHPLDREALLAVYGRLEPHALPEDIAEDLGAWENTSLHLHGDGFNMSVDFGVAFRNGLAQPWVEGPGPNGSLRDNPLLSNSFFNPGGTATWSGRLLGFTPAAEAVAGATELQIDLSDLDGELGFSHLESWSARMAPGAIGTGTMWGDGDLAYTVSVSDNTFVQTGGDEGGITGSFFGMLHNEMGGVLQREDLNAAFAGARE